MRTQTIVLSAIVCFPIAAFTGHTLSGVRASNRGFMPVSRPAESLRGLSDDERAQAIGKWRADRQQQEKQKHRELINLMAIEAWKRLLRVTEQEWIVIQPKIDKVQVLGRRRIVHAFGSHDDAGRLHWDRPSRPGGPLGGKTREQMPEGYRIVEELIDLLEDEKSKDEDIRQKMDALQKVRDDARKELAEIGRELAPLLTTSRQEAIFLIMGYTD